MKNILVTVLFLILHLAIWETEASKLNHEDNINDAVFKVYNNFAAYQTLKNFVALNSENGVESTKQLPITNPCTCENYTCACCAGIRVIGFGFERRACAELTFEPVASVVDFKFLLNDDVVFSNKLSTHNRQVCIPVIPITLVGPFDVCVRLYDMNVVEQRLHACLAMMARVSKYPIMVLQFNCMEMGPGGIGLTRPIAGNYNESAPYPTDNFNITTTQTPQLDSNVYDSVPDSS